MGVSENYGTPKSSILIGFSIINHPFLGSPIFGNIHVQLVEAKGECLGLSFLCHSQDTRVLCKGQRLIQRHLLGKPKKLSGRSLRRIFVVLVKDSSRARLAQNLLCKVTMAKKNKTTITTWLNAIQCGLWDRASKLGQHFGLKPSTNPHRPSPETSLPNDLSTSPPGRAEAKVASRSHHPQRVETHLAASRSANLFHENL